MTFQNRQWNETGAEVWLIINDHRLFNADFWKTTHSQLCNIRGQILKIRKLFWDSQFKSSFMNSVVKFQGECRVISCHWNHIQSYAVILELNIWGSKLCCLSGLLCELILHRGFDIVQTFFPVLQPSLENMRDRHLLHPHCIALYAALS